MFATKQYWPAVRAIVVCAVLAVAAAACGTRAREAGMGPCQVNVQGQSGTIATESSRLNCDQINALTGLVPSSPGGYSVEGQSPAIDWNCELLPQDSRAVLLRCRHGGRRFTIRRARSE